MSSRFLVILLALTLLISIVHSIEFPTVSRSDDGFNHLIVSISKARALHILHPNLALHSRFLPAKVQPHYKLSVKLAQRHPVDVTCMNRLLSSCQSQAAVIPSDDGGVAMRLSETLCTNHYIVSIHPDNANQNPTLHLKLNSAIHDLYEQLETNNFRIVLHLTPYPDRYSFEDLKQHIQSYYQDLLNSLQTLSIQAEDIAKRTTDSDEHLAQLDRCRLQIQELPHLHQQALVTMQYSDLNFLTTAGISSEALRTKLLSLRKILSHRLLTSPMLHHDWTTIDSHNISYQDFELSGLLDCIPGDVFLNNILSDDDYMATLLQDTDHSMFFANLLRHYIKRLDPITERLLDTLGTTLSSYENSDHHQLQYLLLLINQYAFGHTTTLKDRIIELLRHLLKSKRLQRENVFLMVFEQLIKAFGSSNCQDAPFIFYQLMNSMSKVLANTRHIPNCFIELSIDGKELALEQLGLDIHYNHLPTLSIASNRRPTPLVVPILLWHVAIFYFADICQTESVKQVALVKEYISQVVAIYQLTPIMVIQAMEVILAVCDYPNTVPKSDVSNINYVNQENLSRGTPVALQVISETITEQIQSHVGQCTPFANQSIILLSYQVPLVIRMMLDSAPLDTAYAALVSLAQQNIQDPQTFAHLLFIESRRFPTRAIHWITRRPMEQDHVGDTIQAKHSLLDLQYKLRNPGSQRLLLLDLAKAAITQAMDHLCTPYEMIQLIKAVLLLIWNVPEHRISLDTVKHTMLNDEISEVHPLDIIKFASRGRISPSNRPIMLKMYLCIFLHWTLAIQK